MSEQRPTPHSIEFERALLGGLIVNAERLRDVTFTGLKADDFFRPSHGLLYALLVDMDAKGEPIDGVTVPERVQRDGRVEQFGGYGYVVGLADEVASTANLPHYAEGIRQKALLRRLIEGSRELITEAARQPDDVGRLLDEAASRIFALGQSDLQRSFERISLTLDEELRRIFQREAAAGGVVGVTTGFRDLDNILAGLHNGDLLILAARPSMGKTALALNIAQNAAMKGGARVAIFSLEMGRHSLVSRMLCAHAGVDANRVRCGTMQDADRARLVDADKELRPVPIYIDDSPGLTMAQLRSRAKRLAAQEGRLGLIVVDYLQLMAGDDPAASRQQQVSDLSRGLKALARDLEVPVMALSQLSRAVESRQDKRPMLSDLRESGAIEQDADVIMFIYRDEYYNKDTSDKKGLAEVIVAKQRNGAVGSIDLVYQSQYTRFADLAERDGLDV